MPRLTTNTVSTVGQVFKAASVLAFKGIGRQPVDVELLEASTPELDDVVRLEDRYGRTGD